MAASPRVEPLREVLVLMGSARREGNSARMLPWLCEGIVEGAGDANLSVRTWWSYDLRVPACDGDEACGVDGHCILRDAMTPLYDPLERAAGIVILSPIFFYGLPSSLKALIDRCQAFWHRTARLGIPILPGYARPGALLAIGGAGGAKNFLGAELTARYFFDALQVRDFATHTFRGLDAPDDILAQPELEAAVRAIGRAYGQRVREALSAFAEPPQ